MLPPVILVAVVFLLSTCCVGALLLGVLHPRLAAASTLDRRLALISVPAEPAVPKSGVPEERHRKRSVEETLREADEKHSARAKRSTKPSLSVRLRQAEIGWSKRTYYLVCIATGLAAMLVILVATGFGTFPAVGFGLSTGMLLPHLYVGFRRNRRFKRFAKEFPNAVDVIVRGVKAGLPLVDCLKIIATEAQEPVKGEFKILVEDQTLGLPLAEAVQRLPERMPLPEASFFAIVIAIQSRTGGSLSEALGNLSKVLRERKKMQAKVKAMSAEAKASGGIIGSLPLIVCTLVYLTSPAYIGILFVTFTGNVVLVGSVLWMLIGVLVMRKMINFEM
jgi:tight adherence protein B